MPYLRSAVAVLVGFLVTAALVTVTTFGAAAVLGLPMSGPPTPTYLVLNLVGSALAGVAGGYLCARAAPRAQSAHVTALAVLLILMTLPAVFAEPVAGRPAWYPLTLAILGPASVMLGGWLHIRWLAGWGDPQPAGRSGVPGV